MKYPVIGFRVHDHDCDIHWGGSECNCSISRERRTMNPRTRGVGRLLEYDSPRGGAAAWIIIAVSAFGIFAIGFALGRLTS